MMPKIHVYTADASLLEDNALFQQLYETVSPQRQRKTDALQFRKEKNLSLCAEYLLQCGCRDFGIPYSGAMIQYGEHGKPYFVNQKICFSLSHCEERALCVISDYEVGCDVEKIREYAAQLPERFFSNSEKKALHLCQTVEEKKKLFFRIWTGKESFLKCTGQGITVPLSSFSVYPFGTVYAEQNRFAIDDSYRLFGQIQEGYAYGLCVKKSGKSDETETIRENQILIFRKDFI